MISRATEEENRRAKSGRAVQVVKRERYFDHNRGIHGIYTEKVCHIRNMLPSFIKFFVPASKSILIEKVCCVRSSGILVSLAAVSLLVSNIFTDCAWIQFAFNGALTQAWNAFPDHCLTVYESPFLGKSFHLSIESRYVANDDGSQANALSLSEDDLLRREVVNLNIASEEHLRLTPETNVQVYKSEKANLPDLDPGGAWIQSTGPIMCCYRVARLGVSTKGLPGPSMENWGHRHGLQAAFLHYNRQVLCWMDSWFGLNIADVDGFGEKARQIVPRLRPRLEAAATTLATEIAAETSAGLAFSFSDETNPFCA